MVGNPGSTGRLLTLAQMEYLRDVDYPARLADYQRRLDVLYALSGKSAEAARRYENTIFGIENSKKATRGYLDGLLDASIMARKEAFEHDFRARIETDPVLAERFGNPWDAIADAQLELATFSTQARYYAMNGSTLMGYAVNLVRVARQAALPEAQRLPAFQGEGLDRARRALLRDQPIDAEVERMQLASWLTAARDALGADDTLVRALLKGRTPEAAAAALVGASELKDAAARASLVEGGVAAVDGCADPLVQAVRDLEPVANGYMRRAAQLNAVVSAQSEKLGQAIFAAYGTALPPDATFTLRISDGVVKGFPMNGTIAPYKTSFYGLFARAAEFDDAPPFQVQRTLARARAPTRPEHAFRLRVHGRHHRRQLGQSGREPGRRGGGPGIRRQHRDAPQPLHLHGRGVAVRERALHGADRGVAPRLRCGAHRRRAARRPSVVTSGGPPRAVGPAGARPAGPRAIHGATRALPWRVPGRLVA